MKHAAAVINMNCVRFLEDGNSMSRGVAANVDEIKIGLNPNLSDSLPPGIWANAVVIP